MPILGILLLLWPWLRALHAQTLKECQQAVEQNYPLIRQYGLIAQIDFVN